MLKKDESIILSASGVYLIISGSILTGLSLSILLSWNMFLKEDSRSFSKLEGSEKRMIEGAIFFTIKYIFSLISINSNRLLNANLLNRCSKFLAFIVKPNCPSVARDRMYLASSFAHPSKRFLFPFISASFLYLLKIYFFKMERDFL